jgi:hypothetical protein
MSAELARLARRHHLEPLAYILEMARLEAEQTAKARPTGPTPANLHDLPVRGGKLQIV